MDKRSSFAGRWFLVGAVVLGCDGGGSKNGPGSCGGAAPCGGALDGTWQVDVNGTCVEGDLAAAMAPADLPSACSGLFQSATATMTGTANFANGIETDNLTKTIDVSVVYTPACVSALAGATVTLTATICSALGPQLMSYPTFTSAVCSFAGGNCDCSVSAQNQLPTAPQVYVVKGNTITYPSGSGPMDYCVSGTTLTVRQVESGITFVFTLHKLAG